MGNELATGSRRSLPPRRAKITAPGTTTRIISRTARSATTSGGGALGEARRIEAAAASDAAVEGVGAPATRPIRPLSAVGAVSPGRSTIDAGSAAMISPRSSCWTSPVTSMASPGSSIVRTSAADGLPIRTWPVPSSIVAVSLAVSVTRPATVTVLPTYAESKPISTFEDPDTAEGSPLLLEAPEPIEPTARSAPSASGEGPRMKSSAVRGRSWKTDESEVERRTMPVATARRPTEALVRAMAAAGSPRTTTGWPSTSISARHRAPAGVNPSIRPQTRTSCHSREPSSGPEIVRGPRACSSPSADRLEAVTVGPPSHLPTLPVTCTRMPTGGTAAESGRMTATAAVLSSTTIVGLPMSSRPAVAVTVASTSTAAPRVPRAEARSP